MIDYSATTFEIKNNQKIAYGLEWGVQIPDYLIELKCCFELELAKEQGGLGKKGHFWRFIEIMYADFYQPDNYFMDVFFENILSNKYPYYFVIGAGGFGKTTLCSLIAIGMYLSNPSKNAVFACTATLDASEGTIWGKIKELYMKHEEEFSKTTKFTEKIIYYHEKINGRIKKSKKHAMSVRPLPKGDRGANRTMQGNHPDVELYVILDEMELSGEIHGVLDNLQRGDVKFTLLGLGNPLDRNSPLGLSCEPMNGWGSVEPLGFKNIKECCWDSVIEGGRVLFFASYLNPRIIYSKKYPEKADYYNERFAYYSTMELLNKKRAEVSYEKWMEQYVGFFAERATGGMFYLIEDGDIKQVKGNELGVFNGYDMPTLYAGLDPSFTHGGDKCVYDVAKFGTLKNGKKGACFQNGQHRHEIYIPPRSEMTTTTEQFLAQEVMKLNNKYGIKPENFSIDTNHRGAGIAEILLSSWGNIYCVNPKSAATERPIYTHRRETAREECATRVTELWILVAKLILSGQIRGLDPVATKQFTTRALFQRDTTLKKTIEPKKEYQKRMSSIGRTGRSPDEGDCVTYIIDNMRENGLLVDHSRHIAEKQKMLDNPFISHNPRTQELIDRQVEEADYLDAIETLDAYDCIETIGLADEDFIY